MTIDIYGYIYYITIDIVDPYIYHKAKLFQLPMNLGRSLRRQPWRSLVVRPCINFGERLLQAVASESLLLVNKDRFLDNETRGEAIAEELMEFWGNFSEVKQDVDLADNDSKATNYILDLMIM